MARPSFDDHEPACARHLRGRGFRADDLRLVDECRCNAGRWSLLEAGNEGDDAAFRYAELNAQATRDMGL